MPSSAWRLVSVHSISSPSSQLGNDAPHARVLVRRLVRRSGNDQRRTRLVDQDRVHLVHDRVVVPALHAVLDLELHVVAQVVEAEFVVGSVGDVGGVCGPALVVVQIVHDHAHRQPQELVNLAHPLGVALGQVVVHRHHVHAVPGQRVQITRERRHQRFAFAGLHLRDLALVQHHAADQLHVEVPHLHRAPARLAHHRESLGQNLVERVLLRLLDLVRVGNAFEPRRNPRFELGRLGLQLFIRELLDLRLHRTDFNHDRSKPLEQPLIRRAKNFG